MWKFVALVGSEGRKSILGGTKIHPLELQNRAKIDLGAPKSAQERPRATQERPRAPQERPRATQERPKAPQERPRATQELLLIVLCSATRSRSAFVMIFDRVSHRARKRGHMRNVCFPMFFCGFPMFFVSRLFFERIGPLERKANEKSAKSIPRAPKIDLRSTKIPLRIPF